MSNPLQSSATSTLRNRTGARNWTNWEESIDLEPSVVATPQGVEDVVDVMRDTQRYPSPVRPAGSRHTTTHCGVTDGGTLVVMRKMERIIEINRESMTVTCEAGALYIDVANALRRHGLHFYVNVEIGNLTMGSAATTGTKDASMAGEFGQVCSYCCGVRMVCASGEIVQVEDNAATATLMQAIRSSYGLLGVVVEVTFRIQAARPMQVWHRSYSPEAFERALPGLRDQDVSIMYYLFPFLDSITVEFRRYGEPGPFRASRWMWRVRNTVWKTIAPAYSRCMTRFVGPRRLRSILIDTYYRAIQVILTAFMRSESTHASDQVIRYPEHKGASAYTFSIWAFPEDGIMPTLRAYFAFCKDYDRRKGFRCDMLNVGYRIAADRNPLFSYSHDGTVMTLDPVTTGSAGWDEFLIAYNDFCSEHGGVPLFNQSKWLTRAQVARAFGDRIDVFWRLRCEYDPDERLLNNYFRELFTPASG